MTDELKRMKIDLNYTKEKTNRTECLFLASDLSDLFFHYRFDHTYSEYRGKPVTWASFTDEVARIEMNIKHDQLKRIIEQRPPLKDDAIEEQLIQPYQSIQHKFDVDIRERNSMTPKRAATAHIRCESAVEQQQLLENAR